jgi:hypothetical protein
LYNNIDLKTPFTSEEAMDMREAIDGHIANVNGSVGNILSDNSNMTKAAEASKRLSILVGAVTTDFTFYSKFKRDIEAMTEYDNIVVAAQEQKHAGAFVYSPVQKNGRCFIGRAFGFYAFYKSYISRLRYRYSWVRKVFFSYTDGVKACCRNIRRQWV